MLDSTQPTTPRESPPPHADQQTPLFVPAPNSRESTNNNSAAQSFCSQREAAPCAGTTCEQGEGEAASHLCKGCAAADRIDSDSICEVEGVCDGKKSRVRLCREVADFPGIVGSGKDVLPVAGGVRGRDRNLPSVCGMSQVRDWGRMHTLVITTT